RSFMGRSGRSWRARPGGLRQTCGTILCADAVSRWPFATYRGKPESHGAPGSVTTVERQLATAQRSPDERVPMVSVVMPCLNEEENIEMCVTRALAVMAREGIDGEVVVADNCSEDRSAEIAARAGARVVSEPRRGYGSAYLAGFAAARGRYIVMLDADLTYDFEEIPRFVAQLDAGAELVM